MAKKKKGLEILKKQLLLTANSTLKHKIEVGKSIDECEDFRSAYQKLQLYMSLGKQWEDLTKDIGAVGQLIREKENEERKKKDKE